MIILSACKISWIIPGKHFLFSEKDITKKIRIELSYVEQEMFRMQEEDSNLFNQFMFEQQTSSQPLGSVSVKGIIGLKNLGNTCYLNSIIQCLSATKPFAQYFLDGSYKHHIAQDNPMSSNGKVAEAFGSLIQTIWSGEKTVVDPSSFKKCIGHFHQLFAGNEQQDSHEFLAVILDKLHEDLNIARRPFPENGPALDSELYQEKELMEIETQKYYIRNCSKVYDMFQGIYRSVLECLVS